MKTINTQSEIKKAFNSASNHKGASATCRLLSDEHEDQQEWSEECDINGVPAKIYYLFSNKEADCDDSIYMPLDADHVTHIELAS